MDKVEADYAVHADRIYLTGLSMGGYGTWALASLGPERFAAIVPICGGGRARDAAKLAELPIWAFHGARDSVVRLEEMQAMIDRAKADGGKPRLTVYPDLGHNSWTRTYDNPELYAWLLS